MPVYIEAPTTISGLDDVESIFLAGGITGCVDWQKVAKNVLMSSDRYAYIINPRRENFDLLDIDVEEEQIKWEADLLLRCTDIMYWFSSETVQPITLFELGHWCTEKSNIIVGCDPEYSRRFDVITQLGIYRPDIKVWGNLDNMLEDIVSLKY